jgi:hypothetical protein
MKIRKVARNGRFVCKRPVLAAVLAVLVGHGMRAEPFRLFGRTENDVIIVTDLTTAGRKIQPATVQAPVYYWAINFGCDYGSTPGDKVPESREIGAVIEKVLASQGYLRADARHPPALYLGFQWGRLESGKLGRNLAYLGGRKLDLMWEVEDNFGDIHPNALLRNFRSPEADKVMTLANEELYAVTINAFDYASVVDTTRKPLLLWQTRIATRGLGAWMKVALPKIIQLAGPSIGRETPVPVFRKPAELLRESIEFGELRVLDDEPEKPKNPGPPKQSK